MQKILVGGGTGYLGQHILRELKNQGYYTIALTRNSQKLTELGINSYIDKIVEAEVTKSDSILGVCEGVDCVISSIGITRQKDNLTYMDVDYQANLNLLAEAQKSKIQKFIYISVLNAHLLKELKIVQAKEAFVEKIKLSGLNYTIIRPNGFFSDMTEILEMAKKGTVYLFGKGEFKGNPIHGKDLAKVCLDHIGKEVQEVDVGGPEILTQTQIAHLAFDALHKKPNIKSVPVWVIQILLFFVRAFTKSTFYGSIEFFLTVLTMDLIAPKYGEIKLADYYKEKIKEGKNV
ncbi:MAG: SDR family oxidoreductase [Leptospiraceae bacterium]|nr:SDR family oxidoreductase [Leptospiraceae bacterium]